VKCSLFTEIQCPDGSLPATRLREFMEQAELADQLGFNTFWIAEIHCQPRFSLLTAPYVVLGAVAQRTHRLRLGVAVNTLPIHHPVSLAEHAAMLDLVSGGRMDFAAGGGHPHSRAYECFGAEHKSTHAVMAEGFEVIRKAWSEEKLVHDGQFFHIPEVVVHPKLVQQPPPPLYMASSSMDGVEVAARLGLNLFLPIHTRTREQVAQYAAAYWEGLAGHSHNRQEKELGLLVPLHLAPTIAAARARAQAGIMSYFRTISEMRADYTEWLNRRRVELPARLRTAAGALVSYEEVCERHAVIGDSALALQVLRQLTKDTAASHVLVWMNIGSMSHDLIKQSMEQFAAEVMPEL
jgi:alkanesulfonate monooxygenase SsuD/methylene tetrahydromethanopterin reductase-like flavin-dependent oxidoreductase (luciferase family)